MNTDQIFLLVWLSALTFLFSAYLIYRLADFLLDFLIHPDMSELDTTSETFL